MAYTKQIFLPERIVALYENGRTTRELALMFNCSTFTVNKQLREYGAKMRPVGRPKKVIKDS